MGDMFSDKAVKLIIGGIYPSQPRRQDPATYIQANKVGDHPAAKAGRITNYASFSGMDIRHDPDFGITE